MRALIQRVKEAEVRVGEVVAGRIGPGLLILLGVARDDGEEDVLWLARKVANLRVFENEAGRMDRSLLETGGEALVVSQFTLYGDCRRGRRPDFTAAAPPDEALPLYRAFCTALRGFGLPVAEGEFGANMLLSLVNEGPVTVMLESKASPERQPSGTGDAGKEVGK